MGHPDSHSLGGRAGNRLFPRVCTLCWSAVHEGPVSRRGASESSQCWLCLCLLWVSSAILQTCPTNMAPSHTVTSWFSLLGPWAHNHLPGDGFTSHTLSQVQGSPHLDAGIAG